MLPLEERIKRRKNKCTLEHLKCGRLKGWMQLLHHNFQAILSKYCYFIYPSMSYLDQESEELMNKPVDEFVDEFHSKLHSIIETEETYHHTRSLYEHIPFGVYDDPSVGHLQREPNETRLEYFFRRLEAAKKIRYMRVQENREQQDKLFDELMEKLEDAWPALYVYKHAVDMYDPVVKMGLSQLKETLCYRDKELDNDIQPPNKVDSQPDEEELQEPLTLSLKLLLKHHLKFELVDEVLYFLRKCRFMSMNHFMYQNKTNKRIQRKMKPEKVEWVLISCDTLEQFMPQELIMFNIFPFMNEKIKLDADPDISYFV